MKSKTLHKTEQFIISKRVRKGSGRVYYELACNMDYWWDNDYADRVRDILDPTRNRSGLWGKSWKYQTRLEAEQALTHLLMVI